MSVQKEGKVCILCHSVCPSEGGKNQVIYVNKLDEQVNIINKFYRNVQFNNYGDKDIHSYDLIQLKGEGERETTLVGVCGKCDVVLKSALESKKRVDQAEICVRRLQTELLRELRTFQGQLDTFYDEMERINTILDKSGSQSPHMEEMDLFERRIRKVLNDLTAMKQHNSYTILDKYKGDQGSSSDEDMRIGRDTPVCEDMASLHVKTEIDPDDHEQSSASEEPERSFICDHEDGSETNADSDDTDNEEDEFVPSNESQSDHEATDDDDDDETQEKSGSSNLKSNTKQSYMPRIKSRTQNKDDYKGMSKFKEAIIRRLVDRKERIIAGKLPRRHGPVVTKEYDDPRDLYFIDYNFQTDILSLDNITIALVEAEHNKYLECSECCFRVEPSKNKDAVDFRMLTHILGKHLHAFQCPICGISKTNDKNYICHMRGHANRYACDICGKQLFTIIALRSHKWRHMNKEEQEAAVKGGLWHPGRNKKVQAGQDSNIKPFQCATCGMSFKLKGGLTLHEQTHQIRDHRTTVCPICGKSMLERSYNNRHKKMCNPQGEQAPEVKCSQCSRTFSTLRNMKDHYKRMHSVDSNKKSHVCLTCSKCFKLRCVLLRHIETHSSERPFACSKGCQMKFKCKDTWRKHAKICDGNGTRPGRKSGKRKPKGK